MASNRLFGPSGAPSSAGSLAANTSGAAAAVLPALQNVTVNTETVILNPANIAAPLLLQIPPNTQLEQRPFEVIASGYLITAASYTVTINVRNGTSTTAASNAAMTGSGGVASVNGKFPWYLRLRLIYDSVSGKLIGTVSGNVAGNIISEANITTQTGISNTGNPVISLVLTVTFGTANAGNSINVQEFAVNF